MCVCVCVCVFTQYVSMCSWGLYFADKQIKAIWRARMFITIKFSIPNLGLPMKREVPANLETEALLHPRLPRLHCLHQLLDRQE